jgi:hypothetical protein
VRIEDASVETVVKEISGLLAAAYQRHVKVVRVAANSSDEELDNAADSSPHVVDGRRTRR